MEQGQTWRSSYTFVLCAACKECLTSAGLLPPGHFVLNVVSQRWLHRSVDNSVLRQHTNRHSRFVMQYDEQLKEENDTVTWCTDGISLS